MANVSTSTIDPPAVGSDPHDLGESPWPVYARKILTPREEALHQHLLAAFADCIIHAQVALSQLIDVPESYPDRASIRNRFSQLVADFVLYRRDLSVIAVIELDDRSHERADRKYADARKDKAIRDAGLRLIRIPAGTVPTSEQLVDLIGHYSTDPSPELTLTPLEDQQERLRATPFEQLDEHSVDWLPDRPLDSRVEENDRKVLSELLRPILKLTGVFLVGWLFYWLLLQSTSSPPPLPISSAPLPFGAVLTKQAALSRQEAATAVAERVANERRARAMAALTKQQAEDAKERMKEKAWQRFYVAPASCEHPPSWRDQVECGNAYMRAKRDFEIKWKD